MGIFAWKVKASVVTQKGGSCIPWNPTSPREAHGNVFIRNDLPSMCRGLFPSATWGRTNREGYGSQSGQYLHS